ncbi:MAG: nucleotidyltransferase family protein [Candidatus Riflebacteria bacterium]
MFGQAEVLISTICLLAGFSSRMGQPKQHLMLGNKTFLTHIIDNLRRNSDLISQIVLVGQKGDDLSREIADAGNLLWLENPCPERGPLSSIRLALEKIPLEAGIMLWPVDHPLIAESTVRTLCQAFLNAPELITVPSIHQRRGHPSIFPARFREQFFTAPENEGARKILQLNPDSINHVLTEDEWVLKNINTPEILKEAELWLDQHGC